MFEIEFQLSGADYRSAIRYLPPGAAQHGADTREKFADPERLSDVIVRSRLERGDGIVFVIAHG